jgi:hypothetical protein
MTVEVSTRSVALRSTAPRRLRSRVALTTASIVGSTLLVELLVGALLVKRSQALATAFVVGGLAVVALIGRPRLSLAVVGATAGFAPDVAIPAGVGGATGLALVCLLGSGLDLRDVPALFGRLRWVPAVLACLWLISGAFAGDVGPARHYLTRLLILPILVAVISRRAAGHDPGLRHSLALPIWLGGAIVTLATLVVSGHSSRLGPFGNYGAWSTFLILAVVACFPLARGSTWRLISLLVPASAALFLTGTRSSTAAGAVAALLALPPSANRSWLKRAWQATIAALVLGALLLSPLGSPVVDRFHSSNLGSKRSSQNRVLLTRTALRVAERHPVLGVGPGLFSVRYAELRAEVNGPILEDTGGKATIETHSFYTAVLAETGFLSFILVVLSLGALLRLRLPPESRWLKAGLVGVLVAGAVQGIDLHLSLPLAVGAVLGVAAQRSRSRVRELS